MTGLLGIPEKEAQKSADKKARRRGSNFIWGPGQIGSTGYANPEHASFAEYLSSALALEKGSLKGLDKTAHRQASERLTQDTAQSKQQVTSRGLSGVSAAGGHRRLSRSAAQRHGDVSARLAPLYQTMLQSHRGAMSELYRKEFGLLTGFQSAGVGGGMG